MNGSEALTRWTSNGSWRSSDSHGSRNDWNNDRNDWNNGGISPRDQADVRQWLECSNVGWFVPDTRIVPCKTPFEGWLADSAYENGILEDHQWFGKQELLESCNEQGTPLGLVIDLVNTSKCTGLRVEDSWWMLVGCDGMIAAAHRKLRRFGVPSSTGESAHVLAMAGIVKTSSWPSSSGLKRKASDALDEVALKRSQALRDAQKAAALKRAEQKVGQLRDPRSGQAVSSHASASSHGHSHSSHSHHGHGSHGGHGHVSRSSSGLSKSQSHGSLQHSNSKTSVTSERPNYYRSSSGELICRKCRQKYDPRYKLEFKDCDLV
eukprot:symbB.v1.2.013656.t1/scaffold973.1/size147933/1